jgi:DNA ligase (NAD+)
MRLHPTIRTRVVAERIQQFRQRETGSELLDDGALIKCQNLDCPSRVVNSIIYFASKNCMNIDGLGNKIAETLVKEEKIYDI